MDLDDVRWATLTGGYRAPYDPRGALRAIETNENAPAAWSELWEELHHQGDIGTASNASIVALAGWAAKQRPHDWNPYALAAVVEECRSDNRNPPVPDWLAADYGNAWKLLFDTALAVLPGVDGDDLINSLIAVIATHKQKPALARLALLSEEERRTVLVEIGWG